MTAAVKHPAKFSPSILAVIEPWLDGGGPVLDPMAGTGRLASIDPYAYLNELEPEWAALCATTYPWARVTCGDARRLPYDDGDFLTIATSCTYGNRMADHHTPSSADTSKRNTYRHVLGRPLTEGNTGGMQWGPEYRDAHADIWQECHRVLRPGGRLILNVSNHIRKGVEVDVTWWHHRTLLGLGFVLLDATEVTTPRQRMGANGHLRVAFESVLLFKKV